MLTTVVEVESLKKLDPLIRLALISSTTGAVSPWAEVRKGNAWQYGETDSTAALAGSLINKSYALAGQIEIPPNFGPVGAVLLRLSWPGSHAESVYVEGVTLTGAGTGPTIIPIHSYLFEQQATRVFFPTTGLITQKTPAALQQVSDFSSARVASTQGGKVANQREQAGVTVNQNAIRSLAQPLAHFRVSMGWYAARSPGYAAHMLLARYCNAVP